MVPFYPNIHVSFGDMARDLIGYSQLWAGRKDFNDVFHCGLAQNGVVSGCTAPDSGGDRNKNLCLASVVVTRSPLSLAVPLNSRGSIYIFQCDIKMELRN